MVTRLQLGQESSQVQDDSLFAPAVVASETAGRGFRDAARSGDGQFRVMSFERENVQAARLGP